MSILISDISASFDDESIFESLDLITHCSRDPEAIEECSVFLNRKWIEISMNDWHSHHYAISFFNHQAKLMFLPSVMVHSILNLDYVRLAVESYLWEFVHFPRFIESKEFIGLSGQRIELIKKWLMEIKPHFDGQPEFESICIALSRLYALLPYQKQGSLWGQ